MNIFLPQVRLEELSERTDLLWFWVFAKCWLLCSIIYLIVRLQFPDGLNLYPRPVCFKSALLLSHYMLYFSASAPRPLWSPVTYSTDNSSVSTPLHVSVVISKNAGLGSKETYCSGDKRKDPNQSDSPLQVSVVFTGGFIPSIDHSYVTVCRNICSFLFFSW